MHASVRKYQVDPDRIDDVARRVDESFAARLEDTPGFAGYHLIDCGNRILITVTLGDDRDAVERTVELAAEFVRDELSDVEIERIEAATGEVAVSRGA